jgi:hypothetical protein
MKVVGTSLLRRHSKKQCGGQKKKSTFFQSPQFFQRSGNSKHFFFCFMDSIMEPNKAAHDLAQVRKLIEGMNALVNSSQSHLQQQQQKAEPAEPSIPVTTESAPQSAMTNTSMADTSNPLYNMSQLTTPLNAIIVEVNHLVFNRTLFFSLTRKVTLTYLLIAPGHFFPLTPEFFSFLFFSYS